MSRERELDAWIDGLLDIARKSSEPLAASLKEQPDGRAFFSLRAVI